MWSVARGPIASRDNSLIGWALTGLFFLMKYFVPQQETRAMEKQLCDETKEGMLSSLFKGANCGESKVS
jgi:hypothetical protein